MKSKNKILSFWLKLILLAMPAIALCTIYGVLDPFKVVRSYDDFVSGPGPVRIRLNRDYVSTQTFINNHEQQGYDSFILGSSRSQGFKTQAWLNHLGADAKPFHFDAFGESLLGLYSKVVFMRDEGVPIKNALVVLDSELLRSIVNPTNHIFIMHPATSGESWVHFHLSFLKSYYTTSFFREHWVFVATGERRSYMRKLSRNNHNRIDPLTNDNHMFADRELAKNPEAYYERAHREFETRGTPSQRTEWAEITIGDRQREMLLEIRDIFKAGGTSYQIVISPAYHQVPLNKKDLAFLADTFGPEHMHDFSGVNEFTEDAHNYYDASHYRPVVAEEILRRIYMGTQTSTVTHAE